MTTIETDLIGYLLGALEPHERSRVEAALTDPAVAQRLETLRSALLLLEPDREQPEPPDFLAARTIGFVAEYVVANEWAGSVDEPSDDFPSSEEWFNPLSSVFGDAPPPASNAPRASSAALSPSEEPIGPSGWRRGNVLVAMCLGLIAVGVAIPMVNSFQRRSEVAACQNGLRDLHAALAGYADVRGGILPKVGDPPFETANSFVPILRAAGQITDDIKPCPAVVQTAGARLPVEDAYAYPLGYRDQDGRLFGLRIEPDVPENAMLPVAADRLFRGENGNWTSPHTPGQNVLFLNGNVRFCSTPNVGVNGDPIYTNAAGRVEAGLHRWDTVLAGGSDIP